jgi:hypothetical protein
MSNHIRDNELEESHPIEDLVHEVERRQHNTIHPDLMVNASDADALMLQGSPRITKVQRVGVGIFGIFFFFAGLSLASEIHLKDFWPGYLVAAGFVGLGLKLLWNSIRKNARREEAKDDD